MVKPVQTFIWNLWFLSNPHLSFPSGLLVTHTGFFSEFPEIFSSLIHLWGNFQVFIQDYIPVGTQGQTSLLLITGSQRNTVKQPDEVSPPRAKETTRGHYLLILHSIGTLGECWLQAFLLKASLDTSRSINEIINSCNDCFFESESVSRSVVSFPTSLSVACQAPLFIEFSR